MGPLASLAAAYERRLLDTLQMPYLGLPHAVRLRCDGIELPEPILAEPNSKTKEPHYVGIQCVRDGRPQFVPLRGPCSDRIGRDLTADLVGRGIHPLDIMVASWRSDGKIVFRTAVDHLWWTRRDQQQLNAAAIAV